MRWTSGFEQTVMCGPETSMTSTISDDAGMEARQSITQSSWRTIADIGKRGGTAMARKAHS